MSNFEGCPGSKMMQFNSDETQVDENVKRPSQLRQWPIQLHLISPQAPYYEGADVVLAADCVAYSFADFHNDFLKGRSIAIGCPKLDDEQDVYVDKLTSMVDDAKINTLTVVIMQVPCCRGLLSLAQEAVSRASRKIPVKAVVVSLNGDILSEDWV